MKIKFVDYPLITLNGRRVVFFIFGGLAVTVMTIKNGEDDYE